VAVSGYVDLHSHVLPGIDDGPSELAGSIEMLRAAAESGISTLAATPHLNAGFPDVHVRELAGRCQELRDVITREGIELRLVAGAEVSLVWALEATEEDLRLATYDQRGCDLLVETPSHNALALETLLYELRVKCLRVTLAHPERSAEFQRDPSRLADLAEKGILLQINADAVLGSKPQSGDHRLARHLCKEGLAHVIASDGHRAASWRPITRLAEAASVAEELVGAERAQWMMTVVPRAIVEGAELPEPPPITPPRRGSRRLFRRHR
jgi:protein-tyrosine phosphatase